MRSGRPIPVWFNEEDRSRLEQAAALGGYKHLSKFIRDRSLGRGGHDTAGQDSVEKWADRQELSGRLLELEAGQNEARALLAMLLVLVRRKATMGEVNDLVLACEGADRPAEVLSALLPDLAAALAGFKREDR